MSNRAEPASNVTILEASGVELVDIVAVKAHTTGSYLTVYEFVCNDACPIAKV